MPLEFDSQINDVLLDKVGKILIRLQSIPRWNNAKYAIYEELINQMTNEGYKRFSGDYRTYHLQRKGQHCVYKIPSGQKGALAQFSGMTVRIVCNGSWDQYSGRIFYAKPIGY